MAKHNGHNVWYAVLRDNEDTDHGTGSSRFADALRMARKMRKEGDTDAFIAVIDPADDFCLVEVRDLDDARAPKL